MLRLAVALLALALPADAVRAPPPPEAAFVLLRDGRVVKAAMPRGPVRVRRIGPVRPVVESGPLLALDEPRRRLYALHPGLVVVYDTRTLAIRARIALPDGIRHRGLALGPVSNRLYVSGNRPLRIVDPPTGLAVEDAVVTVVDPATGRVAGVRTARPAEGRSWFVYGIAVSPDERRIALSYHGGCGAETSDLGTTGADVLGLGADATLSPCVPSHPTETYAGCSAVVHGAALAYRDRFVAATGTSKVVELDGDGRVVRELESRLARNHLMQLALDARAGRIYSTGSCRYAPGLTAVTLATGRAVVLAPASGRRAVCAERTAIGRGPLLALVTRPFSLVGGADALLFVEARSGRNVRTLRLGQNPLEVVVGRR